jgi:hypothetical protein
MFGRAILRSVLAAASVATVVAARGAALSLVATLQTLCLTIGIVAIGLGATAQAGNLLVAGSPEYDQAAGNGMRYSGVPCAPGSGVNNGGTAVGYATKYLSGSSLGQRAIRWDASGTAATELGNLGTDGTGYTNVGAYAVNVAGTAVGSASKYGGTSNKGYRAVRWDASGTAATELGNLGTDSGTTYAQAYAVNEAGTAVGHSYKYVSDTYKGDYAVRWAASGTAATELGNLGIDS